MRIESISLWVVACCFVACGGSAIDMGGAVDGGEDGSAQGGAGGTSGAGGFDASAPDVPSQGGTGGGPAGSGGSPPAGYKFDVFNTQLNGAFSYYESERRQPMFDKLATLDSDVLCVTEIWSDADKQALANGAKAYSFPYSYVPVTDWSTPVSDPTDQDGNVPEPPSTPACSASLDKMNAALDCLRDQCMGGNESGQPNDGFKDCIMSCAQTGLIPLITGGAEDRACWSCVFTHMASWETVANTRVQCANYPEARLAFGGASGAMLLSKHPIVGTPEVFVLPSTEWRNTVIRAPIQFSNGASVDYYCGMATWPSTSCLTRPYTGQYGGGGTPMECTKQWAAEQLLQSGKTNKWVKTKSTRAILAGDFYSGAGYKTSGDVEVLKEMYPEAYAKLTYELAPAVPASYTPQCTYCPAENAIITKPGTPTTGDNTWTSFNLLGNIGIPEVTGAAIILSDAVIDVGLTDNGKPVLVPLSPYYGFRSIIDLKP